MTRAPFDTIEKREELWRRLTDGSSLKISRNRIDVRPNVKWTELTDPHNMRALIVAMEWVLRELGASL